MRITVTGAAIIGTLGTIVSAVSSNITRPQSSIVLPSTFKPPQVFKNTNLVRTINLDKGYVRESVNVALENVDSQPQDQYYLPFPADVFEKVGSLEVRDRKDESKLAFAVDQVDFDPSSPVQYYRVTISPPLAPASHQTLSISFSVLHALEPLPAKIEQADKQYLKYAFSAYHLSAYPTLKQKTRVKVPSGDVPDYTIVPSTNSENSEDPQRQAQTFTYGPFGEVPPFAAEAASIRYEFTKPVLYSSVLERDIEVSHWGGNLATEERYWLENHGAVLKHQFDRVKWTSVQYYNPPTSALRELHLPLRIGSVNPYFVDDIGNVSTSRFRSSKKEALLALKPRYPVFGGWKYSFKVGWDLDLRESLRKLKQGDGYVLKVPFLEGPKTPEGISYGLVQVRVILPEGAKNVHFHTPIPLVSNTTSTYHTYMDTSGRTALTLTAVNVADDLRDRDLIVTYEYPFLAGLKKPLTVFAGAFAIFAAAWALGSVDVSIRRKV